MRARSSVTLALRLVGLGSVLLGIYKILSILEETTSPAMESIRSMFASQPMAGMVDPESFRPSYLAPVLFVGVGVALILLSKLVTRVLFSDLEPAESPAEVEGAQRRVRPTFF
jgi:hypothetical protein